MPTELDRIILARLERDAHRRCACQGERHSTTTEAQLIQGHGMRLVDFDRSLRRDALGVSHNEQASVRDAAEGVSAS